MVGAGWLGLGPSQQLFECHEAAVEEAAAS